MDSDKRILTLSANNKLSIGLILRFCLFIGIRAYKEYNSYNLSIGLLFIQIELFHITSRYI